MTRIARILGLALVATVVLAAAGRVAEARQHKYVGEHPSAGGGFCHIHAPHVHVYAAAKADVLYREHDGWKHFVGDPVAYGYVGPKFAYQGAHPVHVDVILGETEVDGDEIEYCYLRGPHYHLAAPPADTHFALRGEMYWYIGAFPPEFETARPRLQRINVVYEPMEYARPTVLVDPPQGWHDVYVEVRGPEVVVEADFPPPPPPPVHVEGHVGLGVEVHVPVPLFEVRVGGGPVIVDDHHHHHGRVETRDHRDVKVKAKKGKKGGRARGHFKGHF